MRIIIGEMGKQYLNKFFTDPTEVRKTGWIINAAFNLVLKKG
jgi:hypothetical protein